MLLKKLAGSRFGRWLFRINLFAILSVLMNNYSYSIAWLPHTPNQGNSGNFKTTENLRETQKVFIFLTQGNSGMF